MHGTYCKHNSLVSSSVSNNNLNLLMYECMCAGTRGHKPKYMGRMSNNNNNNNNNNNMLNNNLLCYFAIQFVYTQITMKWGIRYIDEGFLIWIMPSTYLSHEAINWACTIGFVCILFYSVLSVISILWCFLDLGDNSGYMNSGYGDVRYKVYINESFFVWIIPSTY